MTHSHRSHLGGLKTLKELSGATVHSHALEAPIIEGNASAQTIPLWPLRPPQLIGFRVASQLGLFPHAPCKVDKPDLVEESTIGWLTVMHLPGHTDGNIGLSWDNNRVLAIADTVMTWPSFSAGWPGFNTDEDEFRRSLKRVAELPAEVVGVGHGDPIWEDGAEAIRTLL
jgi:glyoxylase-like metal-dependent hydrolase (beta-lactamase superfamily II)